MQDEETVAAIARLVQANDLEVQQFALGAIFYLSKIEGFVQVAIQAGMMPTIVRLTRTAHGDFGMRCLTTLESMTKDKTCLGRLTLACPDIFKTMRTLIDSTHEETMAAATKTLMNLALGEEENRQKIVAAGTLTPLLKLLNSRSESVVLLGIGLIRNLPDTAGVNDQLIVESRCLERLIELLVFKKSPIPKGRKHDARLFVIETFVLLLRRERNRKAILDMNLVQHVSSVVLKESPKMQAHMTDCLRLLSEQAELRPRMLKMGIIDTMLQLSKSTKELQIVLLTAKVLHQIAEDPAVFVPKWTTPAEGLRGYLVQLVESDNIIISKTVLDFILLLVDDPTMRSLIEQAQMIKVPYLRMVERLEGTVSDEAVPLEMKIILMMILDTAQLTTGLLDW
ncbi:Vacuolar protein 8 [Mortierella alpina]|nr:Vacuolar protein 8 [Mortierella alpina]